VSLAREGLVLIAIAALVAASTYAVALNRRSWPLWLVAFVLTILTLWVAYFSRDPLGAGVRGAALSGMGSLRVASHVAEVDAR
jgi:hypothetical protein